jgi:hypothetical protein
MYSRQESFFELQFVKVETQHVQKSKSLHISIRFVAHLIVAENSDGQNLAPVFFVQPAEVDEHSFVKVLLHV